MEFFFSNRWDYFNTRHWRLGKCTYGICKLIGLNYGDIQQRACLHLETHLPPSIYRNLLVFHNIYISLAIRSRRTLLGSHLENHFTWVRVIGGKLELHNHTLRSHGLDTHVSKLSNLQTTLVMRRLKRKMMS